MSKYFGWILDGFWMKPGCFQTPSKTHLHAKIFWLGFGWVLDETRFHRKLIQNPSESKNILDGFWMGFGIKIQKSSFWFHPKSIQNSPKNLSSFLVVSKTHPKPIQNILTL